MLHYKKKLNKKKNLQEEKRQMKKKKGKGKGKDGKGKADGKGKERSGKDKKKRLIVYAPFSVEAVLFLEMIFTDSSKMLISKQRMS